MRKQTITSRINNNLSKIATYCAEVPLDEIFAAVEAEGCQVVDEAGDLWQGFVCGRQGRANLDVTGATNTYLQIQWYQMPSGNYEINCYVSG